MAAAAVTANKTPSAKMGPTKDSPPTKKKKLNPKLGDLNPHIICKLCKGYFIDPVTIVECLHSFCKTCIVRHVAVSKSCPICDGQIHKTKPLLSMRMDKTLQDIVFKLVPGLYQDEQERRKKFQEQHQPEKPFKADDAGERIYFSFDDKISMSLEYYDPDSQGKSGSMALLDTPKGANGIKTTLKPDTNGNTTGNPNKRYLECPGSVKVQSLKKFISMKYGLSEEFVVDVIYRNDLIPEDYSLVDIAYAYNWRRDTPMQFFYRIFKKTKVLLKRRKRKVKSSESVNDSAGQNGPNKAVPNGSASPPVKKLKMAPLAPPSATTPAVSAAGEKVSPAEKPVKVQKKSPTSKSLQNVLAKTKTNSERFDGLLSSPDTKPPTPPKLEAPPPPVKKEETKDVKLNFVTDIKPKAEAKKEPAKASEGQKKAASAVQQESAKAKTTASAPKPVAKAPVITKAAPKVSSAATTATVPKVSAAATVKTSATVPKVSVPAGKVPETPAKLAVPAPKVSVPSAKAPSDQPLKTSAAPATPKVSAPTPKVTNTAPKVNLATPKVNLATPKVNMATPKVSAPAPKVSASAPTPKASALAVPKLSAAAAPKTPSVSAKAPSAAPTVAAPASKSAPVAKPAPVIAAVDKKPKAEASDDKKPKVEVAAPKVIVPNSQASKPEPKKEFKDAIGSIVREITKKDVDNAIKADQNKVKATSDIKVNIVTKAEATEKKADKKENKTSSNPTQLNLSTIVNNLAKKQESKTGETAKKEPSKELTKSIPSGTTITVKQVPVTSDVKTSQLGVSQQKEKQLSSTESTSIGNTSLKNFVSQNAVAAPAVPAPSKITTTSDLRQFRKSSNASSTSQPTPTPQTPQTQTAVPATTNGGAKAPTGSSQTTALKPTTIPITSQSKLAAAQAAAAKKVGSLSPKPVATSKPLATGKPMATSKPQVNGAKTSPPVIKPIAAKPSPPKAAAPAAPMAPLGPKSPPMVPTTTAFALGATQQALIAAQCITAAANGRVNGAMTAAAIESLPHFAAAQAAALSQAAAAAVVEQQKAAMQNMFRLPLGQTVASTSSPGGYTATPPSNRLQLKVKTTQSTAAATAAQRGITTHATAAPALPASTTAGFPNLYSHMAADTLWKYQAGLAAMAAAGVPVTTAAAGLTSPPSLAPVSSHKSILGPKANQGLRQIPNPSLLSKQNSHSQAVPKSPKSMGGSKAAAAAAEDAKQKLLQQQSLILQQMQAAANSAAQATTSK